MNKRVRASLLAIVLLVAFVLNGTMAVFADSTTLQITQQPTDTFGEVGEIVSTSVVAEGEGLTYQWYYKNTSMTGYAKTNTITDTYMFELTESKDGRRVYCIVTDKNGNTVVSDVVTFRISTLDIVEQPKNVAGALGDTVSTTVVATGEELSYQWYEKDADAADFAVSATTGATYSYELAAEGASCEVYCVITDKYGDIKTSKTVVLEIANELSVTDLPAEVLGNVGDTVRATVAASGVGLKYQWYVKSPGAAGFSKSALASASYTFQMTADKVGRQVYCVVTDKYNNTVTTNTVTFGILVTDPPVITQQPTGAITSIGATVRTSVVAEGEEVTYQWYVKNPGSATFSKSKINLPTYTFQMSAASDGREIYCVVTDKYGNAVTSDTVIFSVSEVAITKQPVSAIGSVGMTMRASVAADGEGVKYQWYVKNPGSAAFSKSSAASDTYIFQMDEASDGRQVYCVVTDKYGSTAQSDTITFTASEIVITEHPSDAYGAIGSTVRAEIAAEGEGLKYQWYVKNPGSATFSKSSFISTYYMFQLAEDNVGREVYCVVTDKYGTTVTSAIATFGLTAPVITQQPVGSNGFAGDTLRTTVIAEGDGIKYQWYVKNPGAANFSKSSFAAPEYIFQMSEAADGRQIYCVVTDKFGTTIQSETVTFNCIYYAEITEQPTNLVGYVGETVSTTIASKGEGLVYQWYAKPAGDEEFTLTDIEGDTFTIELTAEHNGYQFYCIATDEYDHSDTSDVATVTVYAGVLTLDLGDGNTEEITLPADGSYSIEDPVREGYTFLGWVDGEGNPVESTGTLDGSTTFYATWEALYNGALANSKYLLTETGEINVAFLGGSITGGYGSSTGNSWREKTVAWLNENYADATITQINAARGGTGTYFAKHRMDKDLLAYDPDLLFIEFVVNDELEHTTAAQSTANMEAIVRKALAHNPNMDIVFVYTTSVSIGTAKENTWINAFNTIAEHYGIETIYAGAAMGEYDGELTDLFLSDQVHPNDAGYAILADEVIGSVEQLIAYADEPTEITAHVIPEALTENLNTNTKIYSAVKMKQQNPTLSIGSQTFVSYTKDCITMNPGDEFTFTFIGDSVGIYWKSSDDGGVSITCTLDSEQTVTKKAPNNSNGVSYELFSGLDASVAHTLTLTYTGEAKLQIPMIFTTDATPTQQVIDGISVPATGYSPKFEDRIEIGAVSLNGLALSVEIKNISPKWETGDGESYFEYTCYDAQGNVLAVDTLEFGYITTNSSKTLTVTLPEGTASVVLTDFAATFWTKLV